MVTLVWQKPLAPASQATESHRAHFFDPKVPSRKLRFHGSCSAAAGKGFFRVPQQCRQCLCQLCSRELGPRAGQVEPGRRIGNQYYTTISKEVLAPPFLLFCLFLPSFILLCPLLLFLPPAPNCAWFLLQKASSSPSSSGAVPKS